ncbi:MAG: nucleotidyltransferase domain-containing protein [bacterium]|nr:MAG: nucleotidyltransferase domain-containing protein [bacterium]
MRSEVKQICDHTVEVLRNTFGEDFKAVALFGSAAREEETEYSDIDLFAIIENIPQSHFSTIYAF